MLKVHINPPAVGQVYLPALNAVFPGWGDQRRFDWCFRRATDLRAADLMVLTEDDEPAAGSAVTYRTLATVSGETLAVGIMTGSWTLPTYRRRGLFARMIAESAGIAERNGCGYLLAFVTADNTSRRVLEAAGAEVFPTSYFSAPPRAMAAFRSPRLSPQPLTAEIAGRLYSLVNRPQQECVRFTYTSVRDFSAQIFERPASVQLWSDTGGGYLVTEKSGDMITLIYAALAAKPDDGETGAVRLAAELAGNEACGLYHFSASARFAGNAGEMGLNARPGFITAIALGSKSASLAGRWQVWNGDRM